VGLNLRGWLEFWRMICMCRTHGLDVDEIVMNKSADPRLVWLVSVLAAAVCIVYVTHI
jgi:hypothetical protein